MSEVRFITRKWAPAVGGMETYCLRLVEQLRNYHQVEVWALPGRVDQGPPSALGVVAFGLRTFVRLLITPASPVVHVGDMASWPLAWAAALRSRASVIVISAHGSDVSYAARGHLRGRLYAAYLRLGAALLPRIKVAANSRYVAELAIRSGFRDVQVIRMGTDFGRPDHSAPPVHLLFAGRISRGKGLRFLVEEVLPALGPDVRLRVAGTIWDEREGKLLSHPRVDWLGALSPQAIAEEYASSLAVLVPSQEPEGFGLVAAEAAASGGVVVAANHSGLAEAVTPETGFLVESGNAAAWTSCILGIRAWSAARRAAFIERSSRTAARLYGWDRVATDTAQLYRAQSTPGSARNLSGRRDWRAWRGNRAIGSSTERAFREK